jgi:hypothetical protein
VIRILKRLFTWWLAYMAAVITGALVARSRLPVRRSPDEDDVALVSIFEGTELRSIAPAFRGGSVVSAFGGTDLDLRRATASEHGAHLEVTTVYGGTSITVPDTWMVTVIGPTFAGGVDVRVADPAEVGPDAPRLTITARTFFGGTAVVARPVLKAASG